MKYGVKSTPRSAEMGVHAASGKDARHFGHLLGDALRHFDQRVLALMSAQVELPLSLCKLAQHDQISAALIHLTRHLPIEGARASALVRSSGISKQAISAMLEQCEAWGLIERRADATDARAKWVKYTETGLAWLNAFKTAVTRAEEELVRDVGIEVATVLRLGLDAYAHGYN